MLDTDAIYGTFKGRLHRPSAVRIRAYSVNVVIVFNAFDYNGRARVRGQCDRSLNSSTEQFNVCDRRHEQHGRVQLASD